MTARRTRIRSADNLIRGYELAEIDSRKPVSIEDVPKRKAVVSGGGFVQGHLSILQGPARSGRSKLEEKLLNAVLLWLSL
jgi:hypothetical protein